MNPEEMYAKAEAEKREQEQKGLYEIEDLREIKTEVNKDADYLIGSAFDLPTAVGLIAL